ncbi:RNB domain-containing ribonuclease [Dietzia cinnamea]|uniref:RNB domain-containing ribonuclease n=1 Tax=Dietzia TaxID=37914 RepID=UPI0013EADFA6|nr:MULTISPECIES: RNB domain-containing ribonuclease [Dietzia]MCT1885769.1 RNB domain-containing ribonuclease [Dietzia cinnamea]MCT2301354.1 RNB domain-containing ribonuclease [Dietzia cinnamea]
MTALMIDGAGSLDRDDAVTVTERGDGWDATVYVAAVADVVPLGSPADRSALARVHTRYRRSGVKPMLGRELEDAATLSSTQPRPVVAIGMRFTNDGSLTASSISRDLLPAGAAIAYTHQQVGAALSPNSTDPQRAQLSAAYRLARTLIAARRAAGAFAVFDAARGMVTSEEGQLVAMQSGQTPAAYLIVQELMVAANATLARWAIELELPILFRNHVRSAVAPPADALLADVAAELSASPVMTPDALQALTARVNQTLRPATYQPVAIGHFGLQIPAYAHATSPLRRYADLVTQRQVLAQLDGLEPPYAPSVLDDIAEAINSTLRDRAQQISATASATRRKQAATTIASGDYTHTHGRDWLRVLRIAADTALPPSLATEVRRRADAGELDGGQLAVMMRATGHGWPGLLEQVIAAARRVTPHAAASTISAWHQAEDDDRPAPQAEYRQDGPPHDPTFTARVTFAGVASSWTSAASKKLAEREALWEIVEVLAGVRDAPTPADPPQVGDTGLARQPADQATPEGAPVELETLSGKGWLRAARALISDPAGREDELARELRRRADDGTLEPPVVAALLADDSGRWWPLLGELVATMRTTAPHAANSTLSAWQQLRGAPVGSPDLEVRQFGTPHAPLFAIRARLQQWLTSWQCGHAKKAAATQQALWDLVDVIAGNAPPGAVDDAPTAPELEAAADRENGKTIALAHLKRGTGRAAVPPHAEGPLMSSPAEVTASAPPLAHTEVPAQVREHAALVAALGGTPTERAKKYRNAVKSPTAWINNLAAVLHSDAPEVDTTSIEGGYTATITINTPVGAVVGSGAGTNQKTARAVASLGIVLHLFSLT